MHLTERLTRTDPDTILYQFTVDDPTAFTKPWSGEMSMRKTDEPVEEYACNEGTTRWRAFWPVREPKRRRPKAPGRHASKDAVTASRKIP
jgi:hypothetical protein